ncbi:hypothetical protein L9F63_002369, partial [Diploptera punctata]
YEEPSYQGSSSYGSTFGSSVGGAERVIALYALKAHPKYEFAYGVTDHKTGDNHSQKESRDGDVVVGEYSLHEPGGNVRVVKYHADKDGFHAHVINSNGNDHSGAHHQ